MGRVFAGDAPYVGMSEAMSKKRKPKAPAPRDPYWRTRRALGAKREPPAGRYDRTREKAEERAAKREPREDS